MAQKRKLRDGSVGVANTIYLPEKTDKRCATVAKALTGSGTKTSKSAVIVDAVVGKYPE